MPKYPILYEPGSREYVDCLNRTFKAVRDQNRRNRYTVAMSRGNPNPFPRVPAKPSREQLQLIREDREWKQALMGRPDSWWFNRIDKAIEENFYRAKVSCLIWWDRCETEPLDHAAWHERMEGYDFERDLECDWELVEYALHCVGYPPLRAHQLSFEAKDRKKWKAHRRLTYKCFECDAEKTNLSYPPQRCPNCGKHGTMEQI